MDKLITKELYNDLRIKWFETIGFFVAIGQESYELFRDLFTFRNNQIFVNIQKLENLNEVIKYSIKTAPNLLKGLYDTLNSLLFPDKVYYDCNKHNNFK